MDNFQVELRRPAQKHLRKLPDFAYRAALEAFAEMAVNPFMGDFQKLKGKHGGYRRRIGDYRIFFDVDTATHLVLISGVKPRGQSYKG